ncbi:MAG: hypothetical protein ACTSYU_04810 [Promethearchaeota archaeon]
MSENAEQSQEELEEILAEKLESFEKFAESLQNVVAGLSSSLTLIDERLKSIEKNNDTLSSEEG